MSNSFLKINAIGFGAVKTPSTRYRLLQIIPLMINNGVAINFKSSGELSRWSDFYKYALNFLSSDIDAIWIQKKLFSFFRVWLISLKHKIIFDFDDAIWTSERIDRSPLTRWRSSLKLKYVLKKSSLVIAGNDYLAMYASRYAMNVVVIPSVVDVNKYPLKIHAEKDIFVLGWIGQSVNFKYLEELKNVFYQLSLKINFKLLVIADKDFKLDGVCIENRRWSLENEISDILHMDVGLMPLDDTEWTKGKCAFKAIQYMASGIPPVASYVGANISLITDGETGFLPQTTNAWISNILYLAKNYQARSEMGYSARRIIEDSYSLEYLASRLLKVISNLNGESNGSANSLV